MAEKHIFSSISPLSNTSSISLNTMNPSTSVPSSDSSSVDTLLCSLSCNILKISAATNIKRYLTNVWLTLFRHHPNGIYESQLALTYHQMHNEYIVLTEDLKYLLQTHRAINITTTSTHGKLYALKNTQIPHTIRLFDPAVIKPYIAEHIIRILNLFPYGIPCKSVEQILQNISRFTISQIIPNWIDFAISIPHVICIKTHGLNLLMNTLNHTAIPLLVPDPSNAPVCSVSSCTPRIVHNTSNKSPFLEDHQSVFMGGFPHGTTVNDIRRELIKMGFVVIDCTEIKYRKFGFSWVTLSTTAEADYLVQMSPIKMFGMRIDIRPFINREKQRCKMPSDAIILRTMIRLLSDATNVNVGLTFGDVQVMLFERLSHRISATHLLKIINEHPDRLRIKTDTCQTERICLYIY
eukprot:261638_1